ncbi:MAG: hypothetical protein MK212_01305 [Saprospiraceae bacterium]|nr:hypothetical protein [Saprospiraceae bacterium]
MKQLRLILDKYSTLMQKESENIKELLLHLSRKNNQLGIQLLESLFSPEESLTILMDVLRIRFARKKVIHQSQEPFFELFDDNDLLIHNFYIHSSTTNGKISIFDCLLANETKPIHGFFRDENGNSLPLSKIEVLDAKVLFSSSEELNLNQQLTAIRPYLIQILDEPRELRRKRILINTIKRKLFSSNAQIVKEGLLELKDYWGWDKAIEYLWINTIYIPEALRRRFSSQSGLRIDKYHIKYYPRTWHNTINNASGAIRISLAQDFNQVVYDGGAALINSEVQKTLQKILPKLLENE